MATSTPATRPRGRPRKNRKDDSYLTIVLDPEEHDDFTTSFNSSMALAAVEACEPDIRSARANRRDLYESTKRKRRASESPAPESFKKSKKEQEKPPRTPKSPPSAPTEKPQEVTRDSISEGRLQFSPFPEPEIGLTEQQYSHLINDMREILSEMLQNPDVNACMFGYFLNGITEAMESLLTSHYDKLSNQLGSGFKLIEDNKNAYLEMKKDLGKYNSDLVDMTKTLEQVVNMLQTTTKEQQSLAAQLKSLLRTASGQDACQVSSTSSDGGSTSSSQEPTTAPSISPPPPPTGTAVVNAAKAPVTLEVLDKRKKSLEVIQPVTKLAEPPRPSSKERVYTPPPKGGYFSVYEVESARDVAIKFRVHFDKVRTFVWKLLKMTVAREHRSSPLTIEELHKALSSFDSRHVPNNEWPDFIEELHPALKDALEKAKVALGVTQEEIIELCQQGLLNELKNSYGAMRNTAA